MGFWTEIDISALWEDCLLLHLETNVFVPLITIPS